MRPFIIWIVAVALLGTACKKDSATSPSTTTTTTPASPTATETFTGTLSIGGTDFYPFTVVQSGTVNETLVSIGGAGVPSTVQVRLGIGTPDDSGCTGTISSIVKAGSAVQVTTTEQPGTYCAYITDVGNLFAAADFNFTVAHP